VGTIWIRCGLLDILDIDFRKGILAYTISRITYEVPVQTDYVITVGRDELPVMGNNDYSNPFVFYF
jgi:hypothetical protein